MSTGKIAFELRKQEVDVAKLLPTKIIKEHTNIRRFQTIVDSLPEALEKDFKSIEANYTENMMSLTLGRGYIKRLLENSRVLRHLREHHGELLAEFETIAAAESV